ncbi:hypothetical protein H6P81_008589 [Aristolochia fimbriata]|uniref:Uncharacterized protein n=1 Tax=Aristolochia fimbriata TaxID=158543 RepID=A0AAV7EJ62_ARIFI|nr:hypothetical protein H6P81_008589 [Aristolochia fimbriata]
MRLTPSGFTILLEAFESEFIGVLTSKVPPYYAGENVSVRSQFSRANSATNLIVEDKMPVFPLSCFLSFR